METDGERHYCDEDDLDDYYPKDFKEGIILRWVCGKSTKKWVPGKLKNISTFNEVCYYLYS